MKKVILILTAFALLVSAPASFANQPRLVAAYARLTSALTKLDRADDSKTNARLNSAAADLTVARQNLQDAAKNKGFARTEAIKVINEVLVLIATRPITDANLALAKEKTSKACDLVSHARKIGAR